MVVAAVALALAVPLLGACGSDDAGDDRRPNLGGETALQPPPGADQMTPTGPEDPCILLEEAEVEEQFGGPVSPAAGGQYGCSWSIDDPSGGMTTDISIGLANRREGMSIDATWAEMREVEDEDTTTLDGIGDDAYLVDDVMGRRLAFRSGDSILFVSARIYDTPPGTDEKLTALAKLIIERL